MRRLAILGLSVLPLLGFVPAAEATGAAACTVSGTISLSSSTWSIAPAVIECRGLFNRVERILGPGSFRGSGTYDGLAGSGTIDYWIPTSEQDVHITEPHTFVLAGGGGFTTPTLRGGFQIEPPYDGHSLFLAQALLVRFRPPHPPIRKA